MTLNPAQHYDFGFALSLSLDDAFLVIQWGSGAPTGLTETHLAYKTLKLEAIEDYRLRLSDGTKSVHLDSRKATMPPGIGSSNSLAYYITSVLNSPIYQLIQLRLNGVDSPDANVDHSMVQGVYSFYVPSGSVNCRISQLVVYIEDGPLMPGFYGASTSLTNGIKIQVERTPTGTITVTDGNVFTNKDWLKHASSSVRNSWGATSDSIACVIKFTPPLILTTNDAFHVKLNDDFSSLSSHHFAIHVACSRLTTF